jgi:hypothetical protein
VEETLNQEKRIGTGGAGLYYVVVLAAAGAFYVLTCAPTVLWQDSALYVYRIWHNDVEGVLGLALSHPLYIIIGIAVKYIPVGQLAYKANLMSALFGAIAVANLFLLLRLWVNRTLPAAIGAITLTVSWTFWQHSVMAEVYTLSAALLLAELTVLLQYARTKQVGYLYLLATICGGRLVLRVIRYSWLFCWRESKSASDILRSRPSCGLLVRHHTSI